MPALLAAIPAGFSAGAGASAGGSIAAGAAAGGSAATAAGAGAIGTTAASVAGGAAGAVGSLGTLAGAETAITGASGIFSAIGSFAQGRYQNAAAKDQSIELKQQAGLEREQAGVEIAQQDYKAIALMGRIKASAGASGAGTGGSSGEVYKTSTQEQQLNDLYTKRSGQLASQRDLYKAALARSEGSQYAEAGLVQTGTGLLTSAARISNIYKDTTGGMPFYNWGSSGPFAP